MKSKFAVAAPVVLAVLMSCGAPARPAGTSSGGATSSAGGDSASGGNSGGSSGSGGAAGSGSTTSSGGTTQPGGTTGQGGSVASGGVNNAGGNTGAGGVNNAGGKTGTGGATAAGGGTGTGGVTAAGGATGSGGTAGSSGTGPKGPCDIYQAGNTPCASAHSTVRALYSSYAGPLYQLQRASDKTTKDVLVGSGGFADTTVQDSFCSGTTCTIPIIYDQSPNANHLRVTWWAYWLQSGGNPATANAAKITVGGHTGYGIKSGTNVAYRTGTQLAGTAAVSKGSTTVTFTSPQTIPANSPLMFAIQAKDCLPDSWPNNCNAHPYFTTADVTASTTVTLTKAYAGTASASTVAWNQGTKGLASGDDPEAMYSVFDARVYSQWCCFDYGNAEFDGVDDGDATMEALYFGSSIQFGSHGSGSGPWFLADLENGMYAGDLKSESTAVASNTSITGMTYVTGMLRGPSGNKMGIKAGDAQSGKLQVKWDGARPPGYSPMKKQGAIILGTGGDGSNTGAGIWFEGAITNGLPTDATDDAVQANIVAVGYGK
jgi:hypothetical protein